MWLTLVVRLAVGLTYALLVPPWEADNEDGHFAYARYLAVHRTLLRPGDPEAEAIWERFQPPLYYALIAPAIAWLDLGERFEPPERNPYLANGNAGVNYALHSPRPGPEEKRVALAVLLARAAGVAISTASVIFVYRAARLVWPREPGAARAATLLYAFWPQFLFTGSMVTNDVLVTSLSAAFFYLALQIALQGLRMRRGLLLAGVAAGALLSKLNTLGLVPVGAAAVLAGSRLLLRWRSMRLWVTLLGLGGLISAGAWFLASQDFVTSQVFQASTVIDFLRFLPESAAPDSWRGASFVPSAIRYGFRTFLASYGWGNLETYPWLYWLWSLGAVLAGLGLAVSAFRKLLGRRMSGIDDISGSSRDPGARGMRDPGRGGTQRVPRAGSPPHQGREPRGIVLALLGLQLISLVALALALAISRRSVFVLPGRYLLPALPAVTFLLVSGWQALCRPSFQRRLWKLVGLGIVLIGWSIPFETLAPAYAQPRPLATQQAQDLDFPLDAFFGTSVNLVGYAGLTPAVPGDDLGISLCWQATDPVGLNHSLSLELVGPDGQGYGRLTTYPGRGNYPTSFWEVGAPFCDDVRIRVGETIPAPAGAILRVSMLSGSNGEPLPVRIFPGNGKGEAVEIGIKVPPPRLELPDETQPAGYRFGSAIALAGYELRPLSDGREGVEITLYWQALQDVLEDYVVFVHLRDQTEAAYGQDDRQPRGGWYPTFQWERGEIVQDVHTLIFPAAPPVSPLALFVGLYERETGDRPAVEDAQGNRLLNDEVLLADYLEFP